MALYTIILAPDPDVGGFTAICPAMPGAITEGDTRVEALDAMRGVMDAWLDIAREYGDPVPVESPEVIAAEVASVLEDRDELGWDHTIEMTMLASAGLLAA